MKDRSNIILVAPFISSFIKSDIDILSKKYNVIINTYKWANKFMLPFNLLFQFVFFITHIFKADKVIVEFGGYWSLIPSVIGKLFGVPVFIVLHGTDCASIPSIGYGSLRKKMIQFFCGVSYKYATKLLPVSSSLVSVKNTFLQNTDSENQGYKTFFKNNKTDFKVIYNGVDSAFWKPLPNFIKDEKSFISAFSDKQFILKGGDLIIELAEKYADYTFYIAGTIAPKNIRNIPVNVIFLGILSKEKMREYFNKSTYHFQLSIFEGFGLALTEAMLCGCIPIGSSSNIIPEIIGDTGFVLKNRNVNDLDVLVKEVIGLKNKTEYAEKARLRVIKNYSFNNREKELFKAIDGV
ncbi:MAG: glycosyltransferase family 4 protein [Ichthyobacteriaceae bacterium]|nr:glycosyltransferase family 4 protein [Ichthyobacteriaceae bacterium]